MQARKSIVILLFVFSSKQGKVIQIGLSYLKNISFMPDTVPINQQAFKRFNKIGRENRLLVIIILKVMTIVAFHAII